MGAVWGGVGGGLVWWGEFGFFLCNPRPPPPPPRRGGGGVVVVGSSSGKSSSGRLKLWLGALGGWGRGWWVVLCGEEVELQQARPGRACGRGSGMVEVAGSWRSVVFRKVTLGGPSCRIGAEWSWDQ